MGVYIFACVFAYTQYVLRDKENFFSYPERRSLAVYQGEQKSLLLSIFFT